MSSPGVHAPCGAGSRLDTRLGELAGVIRAMNCHGQPAFLLCSRTASRWTRNFVGAGTEFGALSGLPNSSREDDEVRSAVPRIPRLGFAWRGCVREQENELH